MTKRKRSSSNEPSTASIDTSLTPDAVRSMVFGAPFSGKTVLVKLVNIRPVETNTRDSYVRATVCDDQHMADVYCINKHLKNRSAFRTDGAFSYTVSVKGYVTSPANKQETFLCFTSLDIVKVHYPSEQSTLHLRPPQLPQRIQGGTAANFLLDKSPLFSQDILAGSQAFEYTNHNTHEDPSALVKTIDFIAHHQAMQTLHHSSHETTSNTTQNYMTAIRQFEIQQLDRQKASLTTNSEKVPSHLVDNVTCQHKTALEAALAHAATRQDLTPETLQQWHALLCGGGLVPQAGQFRKKKVQAGGTCFAPPEQVQDQVTKLCRAIQSLEARINTTKHPILLAAAVLIGVLDVHPFADGNGRLARIAANWALCRAGLPFCINVFATPAQRRDYVTAIQTTRRNLCTVAMGNVSEDLFVNVMPYSGLLLPMVQLIVEQVSRAIEQCNKVVEEKSILALDEHEAKAARSFREKAAAGTCLICFDERPNVATLCCGKAVHLNCIAQWLSSRNSCPQCRTELPSLPPRIAAPAANPNNNHNNAAVQADLDDTTTSEQLDDTTTSLGDTETASHEEAEAAVDDTTSTGEVSTTEEVQNNDTTESNDDTTDDASDDTTAEEEPVRSHPVCAFAHCRNKPATDCTNGGCGRCCVLYGNYGCSRHNA